MGNFKVLQSSDPMTSDLLTPNRLPDEADAELPSDIFRNQCPLASYLAALELLTPIPRHKLHVCGGLPPLTCPLAHSGIFLYGIAPNVRTAIPNGICYVQFFLPQIYVGHLSGRGCDVHQVHQCLLLLLLILLRMGMASFI